MKNIALFFLLTVSVLTVQAQGEFELDKVTHDFGVISEGTQAKYEFTFTNIGNQPIEISSVKASCGCTTPFYTKEPVMPGETGSIKVNYNSKSRPGVFNKSITIHSNAITSPVLYIKGIVESLDEAKEYSLAEIAKSPKIMIDKNGINMGTLERGNDTKGKFTVTNKGKSDLVIEKMISSCRCIKVAEQNKTIKPGQSHSFDFIYRPSRLGKLEDKLFIYSNDLENKYKGITLLGYSKESLRQNNMLKNNTPSGF